MNFSSQTMSLMTMPQAYRLKQLKVQTGASTQAKSKDEAWQPNVTTVAAMEAALKGELYTADEWFDSCED